MSIGHELLELGFLASPERSNDSMRVKGILLADNQDRELVMMCLPLTKTSGKMFQLRGWQRQGLVPFRSTEAESKEIMATVRLVVNINGHELSQHNIARIFEPSAVAIVDPLLGLSRGWRDSPSGLPRPVHRAHHAAEQFHQAPA